MTNITINEIKKKCIKPMNGFLEVLVLDNTTIYFVWLLVNFLPWVTPNMISVLSGLTIIPATYFYWTGHTILGALFFFLIMFFDASDGKLARLKNQYSPMGLVYEANFDLLRIFLPIMALSYLYYHATQDLSIFLWGFLALFSNYFFMFYGLYTDFKVKLIKDNPNFKIIGERHTLTSVVKLGVFGKLKTWLNKHRLELQFITTEQEIIFFLLFPILAAFLGIHYIKYGLMTGSIIMLAWMLLKYFIYYKRTRHIRYERIT